MNWGRIKFLMALTFIFGTLMIIAIAISMKSFSMWVIAVAAVATTIAFFKNYKD